MGRHVLLERRRQGVERELLQPVAQPRVADDRRPATSSEYIASTTVQSSVPCDGLRPARCSSQVKIPVAWPWYRSSISSIRKTASLSFGIAA